jgi:ElaB/YqjD/DUF883 family membrane-anchored ribosome-binding protein
MNPTKNMKDMSTKELQEMLNTMESLSIAGADHVKQAIKEIKKEIKSRGKK